jgi:uncharacterized protein
VEYLEALDRDECLRLLEGRGVGRIGITVLDLPAIFPVNYAVHDNEILFRTRGGSDLDVATREMMAAFEIDGTDGLYHEGWSVLVVGRCSHVTDPAELDEIQDVRLSPWAGEDRDLYVRIPMEMVSGRRIHHGHP